MIAIIVKVVKQKNKSDRWRLSNTEDETKESLLMRILYCCCCNCKASENKDNRNNGSRNVGSQYVDSTISSSKASRSELSTKNKKKSPSKNVAFEKDYVEAITSVVDEAVQAKASDIEEGKDTKHNCYKPFANNKDEGDDSKEEEIQTLHTASLVEKSNATISRSGTKSDPLAFDLRKVRKSIRQERQQTLAHFTSDQVNPQVSMVVTNRRNREKSDEEKVAIHALLYIWIFFICYFPNVVGGLVKSSNAGGSVWLGIFNRTLQPLQGFLFIMVYW